MTATSSIAKHALDRLERTTEGYEAAPQQAMAYAQKAFDGGAASDWAAMDNLAQAFAMRDIARTLRYLLEKPGFADADRVRVIAKWVEDELVRDAGGTSTSIGSNTIRFERERLVKQLAYTVREYVAELDEDED